jgi:hypothetical protein
MSEEFMGYINVAFQFNGKVKVKLSLYFFLTKHHAMKAYWGIKV